MKYEIGERIRSIRVLRGISQKQLASMIGVSNSCVSNWETGVNRPDADTIAALCIALRASADDLLGVVVEEKNEPAASSGGLQEIQEIFSGLSEDNRAKLLELARLYLAAQRNMKESQ